MVVKSLLGEFLYEAESTRKLLNATPDSAIGFKPAENSWTTGQLAWHISEIYNWYPYTVQGFEFNLDTYDPGERNYASIAAIIKRFEENVDKAKASLESATDQSMFDKWKMIAGGKTVFPEMPRIQVIRSFLMNHIYHHRGELIVYLRLTGNKVPGLYGPTFEDGQSVL